MPAWQDESPAPLRPAAYAILGTDSYEEILDRFKPFGFKKDHMILQAGLWQTIISWAIGLLAQKTGLPNPPTKELLETLSAKPRSKVIQYVLYQTDSPLEAMAELTERGLTEVEAFREVIQFVFERKPKPPRRLRFAVTESSDYLWDLSVKDFRTIIKKYPTLSQKILLHQIQLLEARVHNSNKLTCQKWIQMLRTLSVDSSAKDEIRIEIFDDSLTDTQRMFRLRTEQRRVQLEGTFVDWTQKLAVALEDVKAPKGTKKVTVVAEGLGEVYITVDGEKPGAEIASIRKGLLTISAKINSDQGVTEGEIALLTQIIDENPYLAGKLSLELASLDREIRASEIRIKVYKLALMPEGAGLRKALKILQDCPEEPRRIILPDGTRFKAQWIDGRLAIKAPPDYSFSPYRFKGSRALVVGTENYVEENAVVMKDAYHEQTFVTFGEVAQLRALLQRSETIRGRDAQSIRSALSEFVDNLTVAWLSVNPETEGLSESATRPIRSTAATQAELNWGRGLVYEIADLVNQVSITCDTASYPPEQRSLLGISEISSAEDIHFRIEWISQKYLPLFGETPAAGELYVLLGQLEAQLSDRLLAPDGRSVNGEVRTTIYEIKGLILKQMSERSGYGEDAITQFARSGIRTPNMLAELRFWLTEGNSVVEAGSLTREQRTFLANRATESNLPPDLGRAREYYLQGSFERSVSEYFRFALSEAASTTDRIIAFLQSIPASSAIQDQGKANEALTEAAKLLRGNSEKITDIAKKAVREFILTPWAKLFKLPAEIAAQASLETEQGQANLRIGEIAETIAENLLGRESATYLVDRLSALKEGALPEIESLAERSRAEGLWRYSTEFLTRLSTLTEAEFEIFARSIAPGLESWLLHTYYDESRKIVRRCGYDTERIGSQRVVRLAAEYRPTLFLAKEPAALLRETPADVETFDFELPLSRRSIRPWPRLYEAGNVLGHATLGMLTFMESKYLVQAIMPTPTRNWEANLQGHTVLLTAISVDTALHRGAELYVAHRFGTVGVPQTPAPFSWSRLGGSVGTAMFLWRGVAGTAEMMGASPEASEWIGLGGTGAILGGYRPLIKAISPQVYAEIAHTNPIMAHRIMESGGQVLYGSRAARTIQMVENTVAGGGLAYLATDLTLGVVDSVVDLGYDEIDSYIRNLEYQEHRSQLVNSTLFGDRTDLNFFEKTGYTLWAMVDSVLPPSSFKLSRDIVGSEWREQKRKEIDQQIYQQHYRNAVQLMKRAVLTLDSAFVKLVAEATWNPEPPNLEWILSNLTNHRLNGQANRALSALQDWERYTSQHLKTSDENRLFSHDVIEYGNIRDPEALAYLMEHRINNRLNEIERRIDQLEPLIPVINEGDLAAMKHARRLIERYRKELTILAGRYEMQFDNIERHQFPASW